MMGTEVQKIILAKTETRVVETKYFACPECGSMEHTYDHLEVGKSFGPWYCDHCGYSVKGVIRDNDQIELTPADSRKIKTLVLLRSFEPLEVGKPIFIIVNGMGFQQNGQPLALGENDEYFYNQHTCPWNYLRVPLFHDGDTDPHGIFQHQETILEPTQERYRELIQPGSHDQRLDSYRFEASDLDIDTIKMLFPSLQEET